MSGKYAFGIAGDPTDSTFNRVKESLATMKSRGDFFKLSDMANSFFTLNISNAGNTALLKKLKFMLDGQFPALIFARIGSDGKPSSLLYAKGVGGTQDLNETKVRDLCFFEALPKDKTLWLSYLKNSNDAQKSADSQGVTYLHAAAREGDMEIVQMLLSKGASAPERSSTFFFKTGVMVP